jgi:hypothetical protein
MNSSVASPKAMNVIFKRIDFAIKKELATQIVTRLSKVIILYLLILYIIKKFNGKKNYFVSFLKSTNKGT